MSEIDDEQPVKWAYDGLIHYTRTLEAWFLAERGRAFNESVLPDGKWRLLLGMLVYGSYVDRFLDFCMPSLLASGNLKALTDPLIIIHTDEASVDKLVEGTIPLCEVAKVEIRIIPPEVYSQVNDNVANKYWVLGTAHNIHMHQAKYRGMTFHMLMPDHVYATNYFKNLQRLAKTGIKVIVQNNISSQMETLIPILKEKNFEVNSIELNQLSIEHIHPQVLPFIINGRKDFPGSLLTLFFGRDEVHIMCPHSSIVYLSHDMLMNTSARFPSTIDTQIPFLVPSDVELYVPSPYDDMVYVEISHGDKTAYFKNTGQSLLQFCVLFWTKAFCNRDFEKVFNLTTVLKYPRGYVHPFEPMSDATQQVFKQNLRDAVHNSYEPIKAQLPDYFKEDPSDIINKYLTKEDNN